MRGAAGAALEAGVLVQGAMERRCRPSGRGKAAAGCPPLRLLAPGPSSSLSVPAAV